MMVRLQIEVSEFKCFYPNSTAPIVFGGSRLDELPQVQLPHTEPARA
jgi:hypothetical protein